MALRGSKEWRQAISDGKRFGPKPKRKCKCGNEIGHRNQSGKCQSCNARTSHQKPVVVRSALYARAQKLFPLPDKCERCDNPAQVRHHKDEDPSNNVRSNIEFLCRACHAMEHHG